MMQAGNKQFFQVFPKFSKTERHLNDKIINLFQCQNLMNYKDLTAKNSLSLSSMSCPLPQYVKSAANNVLTAWARQWELLACAAYSVL